MLLSFPVPCPNESTTHTTIHPNPARTEPACVVLKKESPHVIEEKALVFVIGLVSCDPCDIGRYSLKEWSSCNDCCVGTIAVVTGLAECRSCLPGFPSRFFPLPSPSSSSSS